MEVVRQHWFLLGGGVDGCVNVSVCECGPQVSWAPPAGLEVPGLPSVVGPRGPQREPYALHEGAQQINALQQLHFHDGIVQMENEDLGVFLDST